MYLLIVKWISFLKDLWLDLYVVQFYGCLYKYSFWLFDVCKYFRILQKNNGTGNENTKIRLSWNKNTITKDKWYHVKTISFSFPVLACLGQITWKVFIDVDMDVGVHLSARLQTLWCSGERYVHFFFPFCFYSDAKIRQNNVDMKFEK